MSSGSFTIIAPHICGAKINVQINWSADRGTREDPPSYDEERLYGAGHFDEPILQCYKCGVDLDFDDIFQHTIDKLSEGVDQGEHDDGPDYEPDLEPPSAGWDEVWDKIDGRYQ